MLYNAWTAAEALAAGARFVTREQRLPRQDDLDLAHGLPVWPTIRRLFGTLTAYKQLLPAPAPPLRLPLRICLFCAQRFQPTHRGQYLHTRCKQTEGWHDDEPTAWMNGAGSSQPSWLARAGDELRDIIDLT